MEPESYSESGNPIYHYGGREKPFEPVTGDGTLIEVVDAHIQKYFGGGERDIRVFHEIVSDLVHIDVYCVAPTKDRPWYYLVTSGMSERAMTVPKGAEACRRAELCLALPPDWPLTLSGLPDDESHFWPVRWLKVLARFPHEFDTWLWWGHSMPNGDPPEPIADTGFAGVLLMSPLLAPEGFQEVLHPDGETIHFHAMYLLYPEEMDLKLRNGTEALFPGFAKHGVTELVQQSRRNVARKKILGLF